jgi:hypothetical protein
MGVYEWMWIGVKVFFYLHSLQLLLQLVISSVKLYYLKFYYKGAREQEEDDRNPLGIPYKRRR